MPAPVEGEAFRDLPSRLRDHAADRPRQVALVAGDTRLTWAEVAAAMDQVSGALAARGIGRGDVVASLAGLTTDHLLLNLGTLASGAAFAPLPLSASPDALDRMRENAGARLTLADDRAAVTDAEPLGAFLEVARKLPPARPRGSRPDDLFDVLYSSGTTGQPKGIEHDALFRDRQIRRVAHLGFGPDAVTLVSTPLYSNTTLSALLPALGTGGTIVLMQRFDAGDFLALSEAHRVTHAMLVPVQYRRILGHPRFDAADLSSFRVKFSTSAPLGADLTAEILDRWPGRMVNIYGMTEGGVSVILDAGAHRDKLHTVGKAVPGAMLRVIAEDGTRVPIGEAGEVVGHSPTIMRGYRGAPEATRAAVWTDEEGRTFIRTGDVGRLDAEGFLTLLDRKKDVIISGGFNVFACDIEEVLSRHPLVSDCAVVGVPSDAWGETPVAFVVGGGDAEAIRDWANARLGRTQRLAAVRVLPTLPRSEIGKVLKRELRDLWSAEPAHV